MTTPLRLSLTRYVGIGALSLGVVGIVFAVLLIARDGAGASNVGMLLGATGCITGGLVNLSAHRGQRRANGEQSRPSASHL